jgi:hypothetical protein
MIVVCNCGQKSRIRDLSIVAKLRCAACKELLTTEAHRQAARNADVVLELTAMLMAKSDAQWTPEEEVIVRILQAHEQESRK